MNEEAEALLKSLLDFFFHDFSLLVPDGQDR